MQNVCTETQDNWSVWSGFRCQSREVSGFQHLGTLRMESHDFGEFGPLPFDALCHQFLQNSPYLDQQSHGSHASCNANFYTWNILEPKWGPLFWLEKRPCFGGLTFENRGQLSFYRCIMQLYRHICLYTYRWPIALFSIFRGSKSFVVTYIRWSLRGDPWFQEAILKLQHEKDARDRADRERRPDPVAGSWFRFGSVEMMNCAKCFEITCWVAWVHVFSPRITNWIIYMQSFTSFELRMDIFICRDVPSWHWKCNGEFFHALASMLQRPVVGGGQHHLGVRDQMKGMKTSLLCCVRVFELGNARWYHDMMCTHVQLADRKAWEKLGGTIRANCVLSLIRSKSNGTSCGMADLVPRKWSATVPHIWRITALHTSSMQLIGASAYWFAFSFGNFSKAVHKNSTAPYRPSFEVQLPRT